MLIGGLWHGANWTFVVWGAIHGVGLAIERFLRSIVPGAAGLRGPDPLVRCIRAGVGPSCVRRSTSSASAGSSFGHPRSANAFSFLGGVGRFAWVPEYATALVLPGCCSAPDVLHRLPERTAGRGVRACGHQLSDSNRGGDLSVGGNASLRGQLDQCLHLLPVLSRSSRSSRRRGAPARCCWQARCCCWSPPRSVRTPSCTASAICSAGYVASPARPFTSAPRRSCHHPSCWWATRCWSRASTSRRSMPPSDRPPRRAIRDRADHLLRLVLRPAPPDERRARARGGRPVFRAASPARSRYPRRDLRALQHAAARHLPGGGHRRPQPHRNVRALLCERERVLGLAQGSAKEPARSADAVLPVAGGHDDAQRAASATEPVGLVRRPAPAAWRHCGRR